MKIIKDLKNMSADKLREKLGTEWGRMAKEKYNVDAIAKLFEMEYYNVRDNRI